MIAEEEEGRSAMEPVVHDGRAGSRVDLLARVTGTLMVGAACWLPWLSGRLANDQGSVSVSGLPASRWVFFLLTAVLAVTLIVDATAGPSTATTYMSTGAACVLVAGPLLLIGFAELAAVWLAPERLPTSLRRLAVGLDPQAGVVLAALGGAVVLMGTLGRTKATADAGRRVVERAVHRDASAIGLLVGTVALVGVAVGRYGSWIQITSTFGNWDIPGWSLPWFGVLTLVLLMFGLIAVALAAVRPGLGPAVALVVVGWALTFPPAMAITASAIGTMRAPPWVREHLEDIAAAADEIETRPELAVVPEDYRPDVDIPEDVQISVGVGTGAVAVFGLGLAIASAGIALARPGATEREERPT